LQALEDGFDSDEIGCDQAHDRLRRERSLEYTAVSLSVADVVTPEDPDYEQARRLWNGLIDRRPALIARPTDAHEVGRAIGYARAEGLPLAVRCGGHSVPGHSSVEGGLVIDLSAHLGGVEVDAGARRVRVGGGALLGALDRATQRHGLVVPSGHVSHTGVGGLTLGGGTGWLMRRYGLTIDSLRSAEIVTANGDVARASEDEQPDLFWALRGGGGNFGVVTEFEFEAHPLGTELVAGMLVYPLAQAREVLGFVRDSMERVPDELTSFPVFVTAPPQPPFPPELQGAPVLAIGVAYAGATVEGMRVLEPLKRFAAPALDLAGPMPYLALQTMLDASVPHGLHNYNRAEWLDQLGDDAIATLVEHAERISSPLSQIILARMGGAVARVPADATAFPHRQARNLLWIVSAWRPDEDAARHLQWAREISDALKPYTAGGVYVNALGDEPANRVRSAYGTNWQRLTEIKRQYDPDNVFHSNANIQPMRD
jgi:FAD/FMN-containing dehydrogenase